MKKTSRSQEISVNSFNEELFSSDRSGQLGITQDVISVQTCSSEDSKSLNVEQTHDRSGKLGKDTVAVQNDFEVYNEAETLNNNDETIRDRIEADMDFKIPGLPHSIVKHAPSASVRELIQKIENHPNRHALQRDWRPSQSLNPFSPESKQMIHEDGNIELCELLETEPKTQCKLYIQYNFEEKVVDDQETILEFTGKIQELHNEVNCMHDSRDFQGAESVRSGLSQVPSQPACPEGWALQCMRSTGGGGPAIVPKLACVQTPLLGGDARRERGRTNVLPWTKEDGLTLSHQNKILLRTISRRKWSIFFDTIKRYSEKKMQQLNSTE